MIGTGTASDPFYVARDEVQNALDAVKRRVDDWQRQGQQQGADSLAQEVERVETDLQDLDEAIKIAASNPGRYHVEPAELANRRQFVATTRESLRECREGLAKAREAEQARRRRQREEEMRQRQNKQEARNARFIDSQRQEQDQVVAHQDQELDELT